EDVESSTAPSNFPSGCSPTSEPPSGPTPGDVDDSVVQPPVPASTPLANAATSVTNAARRRTLQSLLLSPLSGSAVLEKGTGLRWPLRPLVVAEEPLDPA